MTVDVRLNTSWLTKSWFENMNADLRAFFVGALMLSASLEQDGLVLERQLSNLHPDGVRRPDLEAELVERDLWERVSGGYRFKRWDTPALHEPLALGQSLAAHVNDLRARKRQNKRDQRERRAMERQQSPVMSPVTKNSETTRSVTGDVGHRPQANYGVTRRVSNGAVDEPEWLASPEGVDTFDSPRSEPPESAGREWDRPDPERLQGHPKQPPGTGPISPPQVMTSQFAQGSAGEAIASTRSLIDDLDAGKY